MPTIHEVRPIRAAGGIVWRDVERRQIAVVYRDRHVRGECSLPKGKLEPGEEWERAAVREVLEETGCEAETGRLVEPVLYHVRGRPKIVAFFEMVAIREHGFEASEEVRHAAWLSPAAALESLTYGLEREVLRKCLEAGN